MKTSQNIDDYNLEFAAHAFKILCDPDRIRIVQLLEEYGELNVTKIYIKLDLLQAETSHHLGQLRKYRIVNKVSRGKFRIYSLNKPLVDKIIQYSEMLFKS